MLVFIPKRACAFWNSDLALFWSLSLIGSAFNSVAGACCTTVHTKFHGILATFCPCDISHEVQQVELRLTCPGDKISPKLALHNYKSISLHEGPDVAATYPWDMYPQHFHMCANVVILSLLHVPATRSCYMSPQCVLHKFFCRCNMSLRHAPAT